MHPSSMLEMSSFISNYLPRDRELDILDVGSYNVNGTYKEFIVDPMWTYTGMDISEGPNVDIVGWENVTKEYDVIISGQCMEHVNRPWDWIKLIKKHLKKTGITCIIAPHTWGEHKHPIDTYRYFPDGMRDLFNHAELTVIAIYRNATDTVGIGLANPIDLGV
jgi:hypothetical protein